MTSDFTDTLLRWYDANGRDLPWRHTRDPYAIWLSEIILQQTRIAQGRAYWERFMERFPTVELLAAASEDEVLRLWQGLGYYSRARNLHAAARQIVSLGRFPDTLDGIRALKGVGDYTAAAIGSIAFGLDAAVVDGNVYRVLARYFGMTEPLGSTAARKAFAARARALLPPGRAAAFNQAMMDFGAVQCIPQRPDCLSCPLQKSCHAFRTGRTGLLPVKGRKNAVQTRRMSYLFVHWQGRSAWRRRSAGDIWQGLWEPVLLEDTLPEGGSVEQALATWADYGTLTELARGVRHQLTHRTLVADAWELEARQEPPLPEGWTWIPDDELEKLGKPRLIGILQEKGKSLSSQKAQNP